LTKNCQWLEIKQAVKNKLCNNLSKHFDKYPSQGGYFRT